MYVVYAAYAVCSAYVGCAVDSAAYAVYSAYAVCAVDFAAYAVYSAYVVHAVYNTYDAVYEDKDKDKEAPGGNSPDGTRSPTLQGGIWELEA